MLNKKYATIAILVVGIAIGFAMLNGVDFTATNGKTLQQGESLVQLAMEMRPAATGPSPEQSQLKQQPERVRPETVQPPTPAELANSCNQRPSCREKLDAAQKGQKPIAPRPAATVESPENAQLKKHPLPSQPSMPPPVPKSELTFPSESPLLSWLNPFQVTEALAQTPFAVTLTPVNNYNSTPYISFRIWGGIHSTNGYHSLLPGVSSTGYAITENKPYLYLEMNAPATGWYLISVRAERGVAKLKHQYNGPIIETWDFLTTPTCTYCDYVTTEYLQAGNHNFYFWMTTAQYSDPYILSVTVKTAP